MSARVRRGAADEGSMAVEIVVLVPVLVLLLMLVVAFGRHVSAEGQTQAAAREAVRAASLARNAPDAQLAAQQAVDSTVPDTLTCEPVILDGAFVAGGTITTTVVCRVSYENLGAIGLRGSATLTATSSAPLDRFRSTGAAP